MAWRMACRRSLQNGTRAVGSPPGACTELLDHDWSTPIFTYLHIHGKARVGNRLTGHAHKRSRSRASWAFSIPYHVCIIVNYCGHQLGYQVLNGEMADHQHGNLHTCTTRRESSWIHHSYHLWRVQNLGICCAKNGWATSKIGTGRPVQKFLGKTTFRNCSSSRGCQRLAWNSSGPRTDPRGTPQQPLQAGIWVCITSRHWKWLASTENDQ